MAKGLDRLRRDLQKAYAVYTLLVSEITWMLMLVRGFLFSSFIERQPFFPVSLVASLVVFVEGLAPRAWIVSGRTRKRRMRCTRSSSPR
jgi:hypothetical protein